MDKETSADYMTRWTEIKLRQVAEKKRWKCENPSCPGRGGGLEAHHGIFSRSKQHKEYDCEENMVIVCHKCNVSRVLDNKDGRVWALKHATKRYGKAHMKAWLEGLRATHKDHSDIEWLLRVLED